MYLVLSTSFRLLAAFATKTTQFIVFHSLIPIPTLALIKGLSLLLSKVALSQVARALVRTYRTKTTSYGLLRRDAYGKATRNLICHQI